MALKQPLILISKTKNGMISYKTVARNGEDLSRSTHLHETHQRAMIGIRAEMRVYNSSTVHIVDNVRKIEYDLVFDGNKTTKENVIDIVYPTKKQKTQ